MRALRGTRLEWGWKRFSRWILSSECSWPLQGCSGCMEQDNVFKGGRLDGSILSDGQVEMVDR